MHAHTVIHLCYILLQYDVHTDEVTALQLISASQRYDVEFGNWCNHLITRVRNRTTLHNSTQ